MPVACMLAQVAVEGYFFISIACNMTAFVKVTHSAHSNYERLRQISSDTHS